MHNNAVYAFGCLTRQTVYITHSQQARLSRPHTPNKTFKKTPKKKHKFDYVSCCLLLGGAVAAASATAPQSTLRLPLEYHLRLVQLDAI